MYNAFLSKKHKLPNSVSADIICGLMSNIKGNITKLKKGSITEFKMQERSSSDICSIPIQQKDTNDKGFYSSIFGPIITDKYVKFKWSNIEHDYKLVYNSLLDRYYVHVPIHKDTKIVPNRNPIGIMDPGSAVFQELYGLDHTLSFGVGLHKPIMKRINKVEYLQKRIDDASFNKQEKAKRTERKRIQELERKKRYEKEKKEYQSLLRCPKKESDEAKNERIQKLKRIERQEKRETVTKVPNKTSKKKSLKKAIVRERRKIKGLITELHNKTCLYLCRNYDRIMVTDFSCKKVNSKFGKLHKDVKKVLTELSHYRFRQRLQNKCAEYRCQYLEVTEEYTSKTCCECGNIKWDLGSDREYKCDKCLRELNRDANGSINIFIKNRAIVVEE
jgi:transposase